MDAVKKVSRIDLNVFFLHIWIITVKWYIRFIGFGCYAHRVGLFNRLDQQEFFYCQQHDNDTKTLEMFLYMCSSYTVAFVKCEMIFDEISIEKALIICARHVSNQIDACKKINEFFQARTHMWHAAQVEFWNKVIWINKQSEKKFPCEFDRFLLVRIQFDRAIIPFYS